MAELAQVLRPLTPVDDPAALEDLSTGDDAAVYDLGGGRALVVSVDFFTPMVDDPVDFGRIAAANALSDIYAMGGRPLFTLNLLGFPRHLLNEGVVQDILVGANEVATEAGAPILGGHSVDDPEPKFGMVAVGEVPTASIVTNREAREGDVLILTKPLGTGIISTAIKAGEAPPEVIASAVESMCTLNRGAALAMQEVGVSAATDVTGFGLLGHLHRMMLNSGTSAEIESAVVPVFAGVHDLIDAGHIPGGTRRNADDLAEHLEFGDLDEDSRLTLIDAQTSGGLLISVPSPKSEALCARMADSTLVQAVIGRVTAGKAGRITVD